MIESDKVVFTNTAYQVIGKVVNSFLGILMLSLLTRYLGPIGFSEYGIIFSFVGLLILLPDFGLSPLLIREIASKREGKEYFSGVFTLRVVLSFLLFLLTCAAVFFFPYTQTVRIGIILATVANIGILLSSLFWSHFQAKLTYKKIVTAQIVQSVLLWFLVFLGVSLHLPLLYFVIANIIAAWVMFGVSVLMSPFRSRLLLSNKGSLLAIAKSALPFAGWTIISILYLKVDTVLLSLYFNPSKSPDVGLYALSYRIFEVAVIFGGYFTQTLYPFFSQQFEKSNFISYTLRYFRYTALLAIGCGLLMYFLADPFVRIVSGEAYASAIVSVKILSLALFFTILSGYFLAIAASGEKEKFLFLFACVALLVNVVLNLIFIPTFSFVAASWVTVITQGFICLSNSFLAFRILRRKIQHHGT